MYLKARVNESFFQTVKKILENPNEPVSDSSYFDCVESVVEKSKQLGDAINSIPQHARAGKLEEFGEAVTTSQNALIGMTEAAAQVRTVNMGRK